MGDGISDSIKEQRFYDAEERLMTKYEKLLTDYEFTLGYELEHAKEVSKNPKIEIIRKLIEAKKANEYHTKMERRTRLEFRFLRRIVSEMEKK